MKVLITVFICFPQRINSCYLLSCGSKCFAQSSQMGCCLPHPPPGHTHHKMRLLKCPRWVHSSFCSSGSSCAVLSIAPSPSLPYSVSFEGMGNLSVEGVGKDAVIIAINTGVSVCPRGWASQAHHAQAQYCVYASQHREGLFADLGHTLLISHQGKMAQG